MQTLYGSPQGAPKHKLVTYRKNPSGWKRGAAASRNARLTPEHVNSALSAVNNAISSLGPITQHNDRRIWEVDSRIPEEHKDTLSFLSEMSKHWLPAIAKNNIDIKDPRFLHLVGQIVSGVHDEELSRGASVNPEHFKLPIDRPGNINFLRHAMYDIPKVSDKQKHVGEPAWKPWKNLAGLVSRVGNFFEPDLAIDEPRTSPYSGFEYLQKDPYHQVGSQFMDLLGGFASAVHQNPHIADVVDHFGEREEGIAEQGADTSAKQLANYLLSFSAQTQGASTNPGMAKGVKMIKSKLMEISRLLMYDKDRALVEIKKFVKSEPSAEHHHQFTNEEIHELKDVLGWAYIIKKSLMVPDMFKKAWSTETTPWDINAMPPRPYDHYKNKKRGSYDQGTHQHSIIETYVKKDPDADFIDTMLLRLALDRYVEEKKENE